MVLSEKSKQHVDSCRFCWMCHHICPIGNATGHERSTARARALGLSLVLRGALTAEDVAENIYECAGCGGCRSVCTTGWDPVSFTRDARCQLAMEGKLPAYIQKLVQNCLETGNAYGEKALCKELTEAIAAHEKKQDTLLLLGTEARYHAPELAVKAIRVLEKAGVAFTVAAEEPQTGAELEFLIGAAQETKTQMETCAKLLNEYQTVIVYEPEDAKALLQTYGEYGVKLTAKAVTWPAYLAKLLADGKLAVKNTGKKAALQDPFQLARDLEQTEEARAILATCAQPTEMLLHGGETVWAGNPLMAAYLPDVMQGVAARRLQNAESLSIPTVVTVGAAEYVSLKAVPQTKTEILALEELILCAF